MATSDPSSSAPPPAAAPPPHSLRDTHVSTPEAGLLSRGGYFLLFRDDTGAAARPNGSTTSNLVAVPVEEWHTFRPPLRHAVPTLEEAEAAMEARARGGAGGVGVAATHTRLAALLNRADEMETAAINGGNAAGAAAAAARGNIDDDDDEGGGSSRLLSLRVVRLSSEDPSPSPTVPAAETTTATATAAATATATATATAAASASVPDDAIPVAEGVPPLPSDALSPKGSSERSRLGEGRS